MTAALMPRPDQIQARALQEHSRVDLPVPVQAVAVGRQKPQQIAQQLQSLCPAKHFAWKLAKFTVLGANVRHFSASMTTWL